MQNTNQVNLVEQAEQYYSAGKISKDNAEYDDACNCFSEAAPLYDILARQAKSPKERIGYLEKLRECLQPLAVQTLMPGFDTRPWSRIIRKLDEISKEIAELDRLQ